MATINTSNSSFMNLDTFMDLVKDFNVIGFALAIIITSNIQELANAFIDGIILPTIQPLIDSIGGGKNSKLYIGESIVIDYQKFLSAFIKFIVLSVLIYFAFSFGIQISKPTSWVSVRSVAPGVKL